MARYFHDCPRCGSDAGSIGMFASYFDIYECGDCRKRFCFKCRDSNGGRECPCGSTDFSAVGRVAKG
ncbi:MAG: hypothetical protein U0326_07330 [Polyangiales bacterium]